MKRRMHFPFSAILRLFFLAFALAPIVWLFITSIKPVQEIITFPVQYLPSRVVADNYASAILRNNFLTYFKNSMIISVSTAVTTTALAVFSGYALTRFQFRGKSISLLLFLATQMVPVAVIIVPLFIIFSRLGLTDSLFGLILVYTALNIPFCTLVIRGFFFRIPVALEEAAHIDGCTRLQGIVRIVLPIMRPGIVSTAVFAFIGAWNELFFNSIFINSEANRTVPAAVSMFVGKYNIDWGMIAATGILALLPVAILFMIIQKYLVSGLSSGAVKD